MVQDSRPSISRGIDRPQQARRITGGSEPKLLRASRDARSKLVIGCLRPLSSGGGSDPVRRLWFVAQCSAQASTSEQAR